MKIKIKHQFLLLGIYFLLTKNYCLLRWKPAIENSNIKHVLLYSNSDGTVHQVHTPSGKELWDKEEEKNSILSLDYSIDG